MKQHILFVLWFALAFVIDGCSHKNNPDSNRTQFGVADTVKYNPTWTFRSHGKDDPDYGVVFPQNSVNRIDITMASNQWDSVKANMKNLFGIDFGENNGMGGAFTDAETDFIDVMVEFNNRQWKNVGFRLKGNSSLARAWSEGNHKLPFRLSFDKFEDTIPAITNQRFFGFKSLSFSPAFNDPSLMREKLAPEIFRMAGIAAAQTSFYRVYINFGDGSKYCGVYTVVELPDDTMIKHQFGEKNGNIYKPESSFSEFVASDFEKKNNTSEADYGDVQAFVDILNSPLRTADAPKWRDSLEQVFNVDYFLKYLAVNNAIVNWDTYGNMPHNFYLYHHSALKLMWIPWDHNEALFGNPDIIGTAHKGGPPPKGRPSGPMPPNGKPAGALFPAPMDKPIKPLDSAKIKLGGKFMESGGFELPDGFPGPGKMGLSLSMNEVDDNWPLIKHLMADDVYFKQYKAYLRWVNDGVLMQSELESLIDNYYALVLPYAIGPNGEQPGYTYLRNDEDFAQAASELKTHLANRKMLIEKYLP